MSDVTVSVVVPAFNAAATLGRTLEALSRQTCFQPYEVIVVDDGSTDNTAEILKQWIPVFAGMAKKLTYVRQENAGPASARNHGAKLAQGEYIAFTDSDCVPHEDWISRLMEGFGQVGKGDRHQFLALTGLKAELEPVPFSKEPVPFSIGAVAGSYGIANPESRLARCIHAEILWRHTHLMPEFIQVLGSYNFCIRKSLFEAIGGFNTDYRTASGEDNDLSYKIINYVTKGDGSLGKGDRHQFLALTRLKAELEPVPFSTGVPVSGVPVSGVPVSGVPVLGTVPFGGVPVLGTVPFGIYFERRALVDHHHQTRPAKYLKEQFRHGFWRAKMYRDHPGMMRGDGYTYWKDMVEIPLAAMIVMMALADGIFGPHSGLLIACIVFIFLLLEIFNACKMVAGRQEFFDGIFYGFMLFFRAFARMFGFSTGILTFWGKKRQK